MLFRSQNGILLLTFARREEYHFAEQNVMKLVESIVHSFAVQAQGKGITIQVQDGAPVLAALDGEKIRHTLLNLLANAIDAVDGNGAIVVGVHPAGPEVEIRVSDNGHGLSLEDQGQIFEPFFTRKEKGTGLGLAIAKKIVEGHGGHLSVTSILGQGTTFTVVLPRHRLDARAAA